MISTSERSEQVLSRQLLDTSGNPLNVALLESPVVRVRGNAIALTVTILASRGSFSLFSAPYFSVDGHAWVAGSSISQSAFGQSVVEIAEIGFTYVKVQHFLSGSSAAVIVRSGLTFSSI